jgi:UDP-glucuronate decarboxylase
MKTVMVTGAAGFLGSHLVRHHLNVGDEVWGIDDFTSSDPNSKHLSALHEHPQFMFTEQNIIEGKFMPPRRLTGDVSLVYNMACPASPPIYQDMPVHTLLTCTQGVANVLEYASRHGAVVVHASTSEVYGDPDVSPQRETYRGNVNSYGPRSCYDEGKRAAEALCYDYHKMHDVDVRLVRIFNTYGPHMDSHDGRVVSNFVRQAIQHEKLTIYGDGMQGRSFCYVDDLVRGIVAMGELKSNPRTPINLGNPNEFTVLNLAEMVLKRIYGDSILPRFGISDPNMVENRLLPIDDPTQRCPDISLARTILNWEPKIQLAEGLEKTIEYFKSVL